MRTILRAALLLFIAGAHVHAQWEPRVVWRRELGEGFSGFARAAGGRLVTMYRRAGEEAIVALDRRSGATVWEHAYAVPALEGQDLSQGPGPHATPVVANDVVCAAGVTGRLTCLDEATGRVRWSRELITGLGGTVVHRGYSSTPVIHGSHVIAQVGGEGRALVAFDAATGRELWRGGSLDNTNSSPVLVDIGGRAHVVVFMKDAVAAIDAATGKQLWTHAHPQRFDDNITRPLWLPHRQLLIVSSALDGGTRTLRLDATGAREVWHQPRVGAYYTNLMPVGDLVVLSSGGVGPTFFSALDITDGRIIWQTREIKRANGLVVDGRLILRDEEGGLSVVSVSRNGAEVERAATVLAAGAPSPPTIIGNILYVRGRTHAMALDLAVRVAPHASCRPFVSGIQNQKMAARTNATEHIRSATPKPLVCASVPTANGATALATRPML